MTLGPPKVSNVSIIICLASKVPRLKSNTVRVCFCPPPSIGPFGKHGRVHVDRCTGSLRFVFQVKEFGRAQGASVPALSSPDKTCCLRLADPIQTVKPQGKGITIAAVRFAASQSAILRIAWQWSRAQERNQKSRRDASSDLRKPFLQNEEHQLLKQTEHALYSKPA